MVEDIEEFSFELKLQSVSDWKLSTDREVPLRSSEPAQCISSQVPLALRESRHGINRRACECIVVKRLAARILRSVQIKWFPWHYIGTENHLLGWSRN